MSGKRQLRSFAIADAGSLAESSLERRATLHDKRPVAALMRQLIYVQGTECKFYSGAYTVQLPALISSI